jgi:two-component system KDP operon response regulator KdpE
VLVVDDDPDTRTLMTDILEEDQYAVQSCSCGEDALAALRRDKFDLVLTDIKMPRMSGIELLLRIRRMNLDIQVILITAYASVETAIQAVRGEAFDYIEKPFSLSHFRRRVSEALQPRASGQHQHDVMHYRDLSIDRTARRVWLGEPEIKLTRLEYNVLAYLFEHQGCAISREELLREVWEAQEVDDRGQAVVKTCIGRLRRKIGDDAHAPEYITNVWGVGYQLGE